MGIFGKLKNIFYDEEIVEVPEKEVTIKKEEVVKPRIEEVEVPKREEPIVQSRIENTFSERELFKSEPTFKFPVVDEDDEDDLPIKTRSRSNVVDIEKREEPIKREIKKPSISVSNGPTPKVSGPSNVTSERVFKPSPVISPVYGILDKNYKKEEIAVKSEPSVRPSGNGFNYDYVRRKAYGTLEDELENTLTKLSNEVTEEVEDLVNEEEGIDSKSIEDLLSEIEGNANISIGEIEEKIKDNEEAHEEILEREEVGKIEEEIKIDNDMTLDVNDKTLEHDLFNLIDSMYEEKEGE